MDKWIDRIKTLAAVVTAGTVVTGFAYGIVSKMGFVISRAEAQNIVTLAVQQATAQTNAALLDEVKARQKADLQMQLDDANARISELLDEDTLSKGEEYELEQLKKRVDQLSNQISSLQ